MNDYHDQRYDDGIGPAQIIGALIAVGVFGGERGQLVLGRLKRITGIGILICLAAACATPLVSADLWKMWLLACLAWAAIGVLFWCYVAVAKWLTRGASTSETDAQ